MQRNTRQRSIILKVFETENRPLTPQEVLSLSQSELSSLSIATIYRALKEFITEELIQPVEISCIGTLYEPFRRDHHHHFHCRDCNRVYEVNECHMDLRQFSLPGCIVESHETTFHGVCAECSKVV